MFLPQESIEKNVLRQGDIIKNIHLLGAINLNSVHYSVSQLNQEEYMAWNVPNKPIFGDAMVVSHSCEIDRENKVKVTSVILAPIRDVNTATSPERVQALIDSNYIDTESPAASFLKYLYVEPNPALQYSNGAIVDFSKIFSVRKQYYDQLLERKVVQLNEIASLNMALKLAVYFYRRESLAA